MKKILFIATCDITKRTGGGLANLAYYNSLKALFPGKVDLAMAEENCNGIYSESIKIPKQKGKLRKILLFLLKGEQHRNKEFFKNFIQKDIINNYSHVFINGGVYAGDMINFFHSKGLKVVVIHHNLEVEYCMDNKTFNTLYGITPYFVKKNEKMAYKCSDANCFLTKSDIDLFRHMYGSTTSKEFLLGTFEFQNVDFKTLGGNSFKKSKNIIISGSMDSYQTINGVMNFKNKYFDIIQKKFPQWKIIISGRNPSDSIQKFCKENSDLITLIPNPENMDEIINKGNIFLCPTCIGGGLKLRLMDGLRNGLPVLTHKVSSRGYDSFFDTPFFKIYDDAQSFEIGLKSIINYIEQNTNNKDLIQNKYNDEFSFESGCKRMAALMNLID